MKTLTSATWASETLTSDTRASKTRMGQGSEAYGHIDIDLIRQPQLLGCERAPFLVMLATVSFVTLVVFGVTPQGIVGGVMLFCAGLIVLRRCAVVDPHWFAVRLEAIKYPRHMPNVLPDKTLPRHLPFVGFGDPPHRRTIFLAWAFVIGTQTLLCVPVWFLVGHLWAMGVFASVFALTLVIVFGRDPGQYHRG